MSRVCQCHRTCRHLVRGGVGDALLPPRKLRMLEAVAGVMVDAADSFDSESLQFDPECEVHGVHPVANSECRCPGTRYSAAEFVAAVVLDMRDAAARFELGHRPRRMKTDEQMKRAG